MGRVVWNSILSLVVVVSFTSGINLERYCKEKCMWGRGGNVCRCSSVHFAGKRLSNTANWPRTRGQPVVQHVYQTVFKGTNNIPESLSTHYDLVSDGTLTQLGEGSLQQQSENDQEQTPRLQRKLNALANKLKDRKFTDPELDYGRRIFEEAWRRYLQEKLMTSRLAGRTKTTDFTPVTDDYDSS